MPGYEELVWIYDKEGNEYACPAEALKGKVKKKKELTKEEKKVKCLNVADIVGTERW